MKRRDFAMLMRRASLALLAVLASVGLAVAQGMTASHFESNGDRIAGWYWLRDSELRQMAEYGFDTVPTTGDLVLDFHVLATDRVSGGPGHEAVFDLLVGYPGDGGMGGVFKVITVTLPNVSPPDDPVGYHTRGSVTIDRATLNVFMPRTKSLYLMIMRRSADANHIAFRKDSVTLRSAGGTGNGGPEIIGDGRTGGATGSGIVSDGRAGGGVSSGTEAATTGARCVLDRPCIGIAADGFRAMGEAEGPWYWLADPALAQYAEFVFETPPESGDLILDIHVLVRDPRGDEGVGRDARFMLLAGYPGSGSLGGQLPPIYVTLPAIELADVPGHDGYHARGLLRLSRAQANEVIPRIGGLFLRVQRIDPGDPAVAFEAGSVRLYPAQDGEAAP